MLRKRKWLPSIRFMQQMETALAASAPAAREHTTYRSAFVCMGNLARVREACGHRIASEFSAQILERLAAFTDDPQRQVVRVGDDCLVLWLPVSEAHDDDVLEQLMVHA